jgi:hypothetical protein
MARVLQLGQVQIICSSGTFLGTRFPRPCPVWKRLLDSSGSQDMIEALELSRDVNSHGTDF